INIPAGLAALALSPVVLRESRGSLTRRSYDPAGALTITGALVLLVYAVVKAPDVGWGDVRTILPLAGAALLAATFGLIESRHHPPLVPLRIFRSRTLAGANAVTVQQHRLADRLGARRRHRLDRCRLPLSGLPGGEQRSEPARRADRGLPVRIRGLCRAGRDRPGAGSRAPWSAAEPGARTAGAGPGGQCQGLRRTQEKR